MRVKATATSFSLRTFTIVVLTLSLIPPVVWFVATRNYAALDELAKTYECYPVTACSFDLNSDGFQDRIEISLEPTNDAPYYSRLKVYVGGDSPALNIENVHVDNTFRTHLAYLEEDGIKKIVIYDTANSQQFFFWNGAELLAAAEPSELERRVRSAMALGDDTGGFHQRIVFELGFAAACLAHYCVILVVVAAYLFRRRMSPRV